MQIFSKEKWQLSIFIAHEQLNQSTFLATINKWAPKKSFRSLPKHVKQVEPQKKIYVPKKLKGGLLLRIWPNLI